MTENEKAVDLDHSHEDSGLVAPFSWVFGNYIQAFSFSIVLMPLLWGLLTLFRKYILPDEEIFWNDEITILTAFTAAGFFANLLSWLFHGLCCDLAKNRPDLLPVFEKQKKVFHDWKWLVVIPVILSIFALGIRYFQGGNYNAYNYPHFDYVWSCWLFCGFFLILNTTVLCARYTEIVRFLSMEAATGKIGRSEMSVLSRFYLKVAIVASFHFALCALTVYSIYIIYTYRGIMWRGTDLLRWIPNLSWTQQIKRAWNDPLFGEVAIFFSLYGSVSIAPALYFIFPQWGVHQLLVERKMALIKNAKLLFDQAESELTPNSADADWDKFVKRSMILESLQKLPEWPFESGGKLGTFFLIGIPTILVLFKEVVLQALLSILFK